MEPNRKLGAALLAAGALSLGWAGWSFLRLPREVHFEGDGLHSSPPRTSTSPPAIDETAPRNFPGLDNVVAFHDGFYTGGAPHADMGFDSLKRLGVHTVISVDGAVPDADRAGARGMRSIHLPIGYDGFDDARRVQLVRAARDARRQGAVYLHCHHGQHRAAGAAATIAVCLGWMTNDEALARMKVAGTSPDYPGLFACAARAEHLSHEAIDAVPDEFVPASIPTDLVSAMLDIDAASDHLKLIEKAGWETPADHPDLVPAAVAGHLADLLRILAESDDARKRPAAFQEFLEQCRRKAAELEEALLGKGLDRERVTEKRQSLTESCKACHAGFRD